MDKRRFTISGFQKEGVFQVYVASQVLHDWVSRTVAHYDDGIQVPHSHQSVNVCLHGNSQPVAIQSKFRLLFPLNRNIQRIHFHLAAGEPGDLTDTL